MKNNTILLLLITSIFAVSCSEKREIVHVRDIVLNCNEQYLLEGGYFQLKATIQPFDADNCKILWSSSDPSVMYPHSPYTYGHAEGNSLIAGCTIKGIAEGDALLTVKSDDGGIVATCSVHVRAPFTLVEGNPCVDLGLSVRWAYCNLGAATPTEYGDFFAWGEIEPKSYYVRDNYKFYGETEKLGNSSYWGYTKYCVGNRDDANISHDNIDGRTTLELSDDAVHRRYRGSWRMPTLEEWDELHKCCTWTWTTVDSVEGYLVRGKNGNQIFLPNAGQKFYDTYFTKSTQYWTSSLDMNAQGNEAAYSYWLMSWRHLSSKDAGSYESRANGYCIRGVIR